MVIVSQKRHCFFCSGTIKIFFHDPTEEDLNICYHVLRYLFGTKHECIYLKPRRDIILKIESFTDEDFAGCRTSRKSTSGGSISLSGPTIHTGRSSKIQLLIPQLNLNSLG